MALKLAAVSFLLSVHAWALPATSSASTSSMQASQTPVISSPPPPVGDLTPQIVELASGSIPNTTAFSRLSPAAQTGFQLLTFLEELEVYLYYEGYQNLTTIWKDQLSQYPSDTLDVISKTAAQEDIHVATLKVVLEGNNVTVPPPCKYSFPASSPEEFFAIANLITPANYGSIIGLESQIAEADPDTILSSTSILATEVRHEVFLRSTAGELPNPAPFDTGIPPAWGYNFGLEYVVPGSCPVEVALQTYPKLYREPRGPVQFAPSVYPTSLNLSWDTSQDWVAREGQKPLFVSWLNQANSPVYTPLQRTGPGSGMTAVPKNLANTAYIALTSIKPETLTDLESAVLAGPLAVPIS